ncbi:transcriptional regulator [Leifsonia sp. Root4]|uniref:GNAT family N-acetyltransferase n=1 Tax=Leifsonia sp. Root4 TaxID=1736525 RepID=UPI0006FD9E27|nr:GNAT family N-acetyltransferase [Leifsonia sp. Root4]KQW05794.1 transcriptional regulator [Leifsonia sp. Root4]
MLIDLVLPAVLDTRTGGLTLRRASARDLDALMTLLSDDPISSSRGDTADVGDRDAYQAALEQILADAANELLVVVDGSDVPIATMQLTRIPGMARRGSTRLLVEAVRVSSALRSAGIGGAMMRWVTDTAAPTLGSTLVQLTSDAARTDAHRFYERLGFIGSHVGFKYPVG